MTRSSRDLTGDETQAERYLGNHCWTGGYSGRETPELDVQEVKSLPSDDSGACLRREEILSGRTQ